MLIFSFLLSSNIPGESLIGITTFFSQIIICQTVISFILFRSLYLTVYIFDGVGIVTATLNFIKEAELVRQCLTLPISCFEILTIICVHSSHSSINQFLDSILIHVIIGPISSPLTAQFGQTISFGLVIFLIGHGTLVIDFLLSLEMLNTL